jgi:transposase, IS30 family
MYAHGFLASHIADELGRKASTITRELKRNTITWAYIAKKAHVKCYQRRYWVTKPTPRLWQMRCDMFWRYAQKKLIQRYPWSPEKIIHRWKLLHPDETWWSCVSTPTFYSYLYRRRPDLCRRLLSKREHRKKRVKNKTAKQLIQNRVWIDERPVEIATNMIPWHWEWDTLGSKKGETDTILGLREKRSRFMLAKDLPSRSPKHTTQCMQRWRKQYKIESETLDNGIEFQGHEQYGCATYFCHPYSSWEKWQIENGMRMLRRKYPKRTSLQIRTQQAKRELQQFVKALNNTPMKCLWWRTPKEVLYNLQPPIQWW